MTVPPPRAPRGAPADGGAARGAAAGPLLQVHEVRKAFGGLRAVDGASFDVRRGTISGLIGPNGAGKTTLFNLVTGFVAPDGGRVLFAGENITGRRPHRVFRAGLCRTFQIPREFRELTVLENLMVVPPDQLGERLWTPWLRPGAVAAEERRIRDKALGVLEFLTLLPPGRRPRLRAVRGAEETPRARSRADGRSRDAAPRRAGGGRQPDAPPAPSTCACPRSTPRRCATSPRFTRR